MISGGWLLGFFIAGLIVSIVATFLNESSDL